MRSWTGDVEVFPTRLVSKTLWANFGQIWVNDKFGEIRGRYHVLVAKFLVLVLTEATHKKITPPKPEDV